MPGGSLAGDHRGRRGPLRDLAHRNEAEGDGAEVVAARLDVSSVREWDEVITAVRDRFGRLTVLVNVAGIVDRPGIEDTSEEAWNRVIDVHQKGT